VSHETSATPRAQPIQTPPTEINKPLYRGAGAPPPAIPRNRFALKRDRMRFYPRLRSVEDHPKAWTFPACLDARVPWVAMLKDLYASPLSFPASLSPEAGLLLHSLVRNTRPRTVVEVGTFLGVSTIWMASALEAAAGDPVHLATAPGSLHGTIHCFDDLGPIPPGPWRPEGTDRSRLELVKDHLDRAGLAHRVRLYPGDSSVRLREEVDHLRGPAPEFTADPREATGGVDFAFIDGDHSIAGALQDLWAIEPAINTGGYVVLHDTFPEQCGDHQGGRYIIDHILEVAQGLYELCELYTAPLNYGMAIFRRVG
jgi:predicted O-methyltransferase YrrM